MNTPVVLITGGPGIARGFIRSLQLDHQLNQLVLAQPLQISAIHALMDFRDWTPWQGARGNQQPRPRSAPQKCRWVITIKGLR